MDGTRLRLVRATAAPTLDRSGVAVDEGTGAFKFPGAVRDVVGGPDPRRLSAADVARLAQRSLDDMQAQLDALRRESGLFAPRTRPDGQGPRAA